MATLDERDDAFGAGWLGDGNLTQWEMIFDERVKFLGSLVEMGIYRVSGILINDYGWVRSLMDAVKGVVLFQGKGLLATDGHRPRDHGTHGKTRKTTTE